MEVCFHCVSRRKFKDVRDRCDKKFFTKGLAILFRKCKELKDLGKGLNLETKRNRDKTKVHEDAFKAFYDSIEKEHIVHKGESCDLKSFFDNFFKLRSVVPLPSVNAEKTDRKNIKCNFSKYTKESCFYFLLFD